MEKLVCTTVQSSRICRCSPINIWFILLTDQESFLFTFDKSYLRKIKKDSATLETRTFKPRFRYSVSSRKEHGSGRFVSSGLHCTTHDPQVTQTTLSLVPFWRHRNTPSCPFKELAVRHRWPKCDILCRQKFIQYKTTVSDCRMFMELKIQLFKPLPGRVINARKPFERLSMNFKDPLSSVSNNTYLLTIVDD